MRTRETGYADYGMSAEEVKSLMAACRSSEKSRETLHRACWQACDSLAEYLEFSLLASVPYDVICRAINIPIGIDSFYGYRRKALAIYKNLQQKDIEKS